VPTIASGAIRLLLSAAEEDGVQAADLLRDVGLEAELVADPDGRIPLEAHHALWEAVLQRAPRPDGAVLVAERYSPGDYGLVGFVAMTSATLGEAMRHVARFLGLWTDDPSIALDDDGALYIRYRSPFSDRVGLRMATEATAAEILNGARRATQQHITPREVRFAHIGPRDASVHEAFFGCPVRFRADETVVMFRAEDLALPLPKADVQLGAYLRSVAGEALEKHGGSEQSELDRIRTIIAEQLQKGVPSLASVAKLTNTSERTLRRRLEAAGTSFRTLLDETRAELARSYVADRRMALSEVAFLLGFSEPSAFHRAFKRWTGATPAAWRQRA
jgi:AraC-like DNA-binding protein